MHSTPSTPKGRGRALRFLTSFVDDMEANGFLAEALARSVQGNASVAP